MKTVTLYVQPGCIYCGHAERLMVRKGIPSERIDISSDPAMRKEMVQRSGQRSTPQIFIGQLHIGGYKDLKALEMSGQLYALLGTP